MPRCLPFVDISFLKLSDIDLFSLYHMVIDRSAALPSAEWWPHNYAAAVSAVASVDVSVVIIYD